MTDTPNSTIEPSDKLFSALGRVIFYFGLLEDSLRHAIVTALNDLDEGDIVVAGLSFPHLLDRFSVLYAPLDVEDIVTGGSRALCTTLSSLNEERNRQIHSTWGFWESGVPARTRKRLQRNRGIAFSMESIEPQVLLDLARRMEVAADLIYEIRIRFYEYKRNRGRGLDA